MAHAGELAEVARYALRRLRILSAKRVAEVTDNKFQIQVFAAGEIVPGLAGRSTRCRTAPSRSATPPPTTTSARTRPSRFGTSRAVRPQHARMNQAWLRIGGGEDLLNELLQEVQRASAARGRQYRLRRWAAGIRKEIKTVDDLKGLKMRIGGWAGKVLQKLGVVPQQIAGGDIYPALEKGTIDACRVGRSVRRREARLLQGRAALLLPRLVGRRLDAFSVRQSRQVERAAEGLSSGARAGRSLRQHVVHGANTTTLNPQALQQLARQRHQAARVLASRSWRPRYKAAQELHAEVAKENPMFKKVNDSLMAFTQERLQWFRWPRTTAIDSFMMRDAQREPERL